MKIERSEFPRATALIVAIIVLSPLHAEAAATPIKSSISRRVEFEKMTWVEVKTALKAGKTTALIYTGGVEERGPQNVNGGHNLMAHATVEAIARKLGNAVFMPVLPYSPNDADADFPGTIGITEELLGAMLARLTEQSIANGFKNVVLMGDHGGGQPAVYAEVARALDAKYAAQAVHVYYCDEVYKANDLFNQYLAAHGYPPSLHAGIPDTSLMMYLDKDNSWVRKRFVHSALGSPVIAGTPQIGPHGPVKGIIGDARRSTALLGKKLFDLKVEQAVKQTQEFLKGKTELRGGS